MSRHQKMSYQKVFTNQYQLGEKAFVGLSSLRPPSDCSIPKNKSSEEGGEYAHVGVGVVHNEVKTALPWCRISIFKTQWIELSLGGVRGAIFYYKEPSFSIVNLNGQVVKVSKNRKQIFQPKLLPKTEPSNFFFYPDK